MSKGVKSFRRDMKTRKLLRFLTKNDFHSVGGTKHGKYRREGDDHSMTVPRHPRITPPTAESICKDLVIKHGFTEDEVLRIF